jgi:hypothetical protein
VTAALVAALVLTAADSGDSFVVHPGATVQVRLVGGWSAPHAAGSALARISLSRRGGYVVATFAARHVGRTAVRAVEGRGARRLVVHVIVRATAAQHALEDLHRDEQGILSLVASPRPRWPAVSNRLAYALLHLAEARAALTRAEYRATAQDLRSADAAAYVHSRARVRAAIRVALSR